MSTNELLALLAIVVGASAQAITGFGFGLVITPMLVICLNPLDGVTLSSALGIALSVLVLAREWRHAQFKYALALLIPAALVAPLAGYVARVASTSMLSIVAGVLILVGVAALASGFRWRKLQGIVGGAISGAISSLMGVLAGVGGPAILLYAMNARWDVKTLRPTLNVYFIGLSAMTLLVRGTPNVDLSFGFGVVIAMVVGFAIGTVFTHRLHHRTVRRMSLALAALGGLAAIVKGLYG